MGIGSREPAGDSCVHGLDNVKIGGEENVEVTLVDLLYLSDKC